VNPAPRFPVVVVPEWMTISVKPNSMGLPIASCRVRTADLRVRRLTDAAGCALLPPCVLENGSQGVIASVRRAAAEATRPCRSSLAITSSTVPGGFRQLSAILCTAP